MTTDKRATILVLCLTFGILAMVIGGCIYWGASVDYNNVVNTPIVPIAELKQHAGTNQPVRIQAVAIGEPTFTTPSGEQIAFEYVEVTHDERHGNNRDTITDYKGWIPSELWVSDGKDKLRVLPESITQDNLDVRGRVAFSSKGEFDEKLKSVILPQFLKDIRTGRHGQEIKACTIAKGANLNIVGAVSATSDGVVVHKAPNRGLWVSVKSADEVASKAKQSMLYSAIAIGIGAIVVIAALAFYIKSKMRG